MTVTPDVLFAVAIVVAWLLAVLVVLGLIAAADKPTPPRPRALPTQRERRAL